MRCILRKWFTLLKKLDLVKTLSLRLRYYQKQPPEVFCKKKVFLEISQNSQKNICARASFLVKLQASACNFVKKEALAHVFFCEFCEISRNTFFTEHLQATASVLLTNQELGVINGGSTVQYFHLEQGAGHGDPASVYLFILYLKEFNKK